MTYPFDLEWQSGPYSPEVIINLVAQLVVFPALGESVLLRVCRFLGARHPTRFDSLHPDYDLRRLPHLYVFGLQLYLVTVFILKCVRMYWLPALLLPAAFLVDLPRLVYPSIHIARAIGRTLRSAIRDAGKRRNTMIGAALLAAWLFLHSWIGSNLLYYRKVSEYDRALFTRWTNVFGDFPFHMGMISSMVLGENFPPDYHFVHGTKLTYPFMVNLWSSTILAPGTFTRWSNLGLAICYQWMIVWALIYFFLNGRKYPLVPLALLFGGRSFDTLHQWSEESLQTGRGYPWSGFMTTVFAPQRSAPFGLAICLSAVALFHSFMNEYENEEPFEQSEPNSAAAETTTTTFGSAFRRWIHPKIILSGLTLSLAPLCHTHICLFSILFIGLSLVFKFSGHIISRFLRAVFSPIRRLISSLFTKAASQEQQQQQQQQEQQQQPADGGWFPFRMFVAIITFGFSLVPSFLSLPWLIAPRTQGMVSFMWGWKDFDHQDYGTPWEQIQRSARMWWANAPFWFVSIAVVWVLLRKHARLLSFLVLFLAANYVKLALWYWDQLKVFIGLYMLFLSIWSLASRNRKALVVVQILCLLLIYPSAHECYKVMMNPEEFHNGPGIYIDYHLDYAEEVISRVPAHSMVLSTDKHNNPVSLTGRKIFLGYAGWLSTHNLFGECSAQRAIQHLPISDLIRKCHESENIRYCPDYVILSHDEEEHWKNRRSKLDKKDEKLSSQVFDSTSHYGIFKSKLPADYYYQKRKKWGDPEL